MNVWDILIIVLTAAAFGAAVFFSVRGRRKNSCSGNCEGCRSCKK